MGRARQKAEALMQFQWKVERLWVASLAGHIWMQTLPGSKFNPKHGCCQLLLEMFICLFKPLDAENVHQWWSWWRYLIDLEPTGKFMRDVAPPQFSPFLPVSDFAWLQCTQLTKKSLNQIISYLCCARGLWIHFKFLFLDHCARLWKGANWEDWLGSVGG